MMSAPNSQDWERLKHVLRALYIGKGHTLEGPEGVMKLMETQHGLKATKTQYEKQFKDWGFQKNRTKQDWKDIGQKIGARKRMAKESNIYLDGKLVPAKKVRKETSRQAYMTIYEQFHQGQESPPGTPPGCEIRTPTALPLLRLVFENLPMFRFQEIMPQLQEFIRPFDTSSSALTPFLGELQQTRNPNAVLPILNSMLPNSALLEEGCANGLAIKRVESLESVEFFNLIVFMISNNFPGESNSRNIYKWLKKNCPPFILKTLSSIATPTAEALLENLFGSAVEAGDVTMVKHLLKAGASPNRPMCRHSSLPDHVTPLQFALSRGNTELAQELIKAGSSINEGGAGWKSSALVLAIIGNNIRGNKRFWGSHGSFSDDGDEDNDYMDTWSLFEPSSQDFAVSGTENDPFFDLIQSLLNTGAAVNPDGVGRSCSSVREWEDDLSPFLEGHSPLTAASKYRHKQLVDVFLQRGADVRFLTDRDASALHECLYSWEEMNDARQLPQSFSERGELRSFPGSGNLSSLVDVAQSLISAGAAVNDESGFSFKPSPSESDFIYCTTLDLGVLTGSAELFDMLVGAGACTATKVSLEHAIYNGYTEIVTRLLNIGAPLAIEAIDGLIESDESCFYAISLLRPNIRIKRALFQEAIRLGATSIINYILNSETSNPQKLFYDMTEAFQQCCAEGHINALRLLLSKSSTFKVSISPWFGRAIEVAIENGHDDILDILLSADPDVDVIVHRESVLLAALRKKNTRIIEKLIRAGVRLSKRNEKCSECERIHESNDVFIAAINLGDYHVINSLIDAGASLHTLGTTDCMLGSKLCMLPLTAAIVGKDLTLVNHLISAGAAMNNPPEAARTTPTPLSAAIANRDLELANTLIQRGSNPYDSIALSEATNEFRLLQTLLMALHNFNEPSNSYGDTLGWEALYRAVEKQDLVMTQELLNSPLRGVKSSQGLCAGLIQAVRFDSSPNFEIIRKFLSLGANPNSSMESYFELRHYDIKNSALCLAIVKNDSRKVELLLEAGGRADKKQTKNLDPYPVLCAISGKNSDILRKLLEYGLDPNKYSGFPSQTPIELATVEGGDTEMIKILLQYGVNPNTRFKGTQHTPLQIASRDGNREVIDLLLEHGADVNSPAAERFGATALQFAAIRGFLGIAFLLLENGADVNAPPAEFEGRTALEGAAEHGRIDMVQLLLNAGANIFHEGQAQYENAVRRASENGHCAVRRLLESYHG